MDPLTILLAKVLGVYLVVIGIALFARRKYFLAVFAGFVENRLLRMVVAIAELVAGLFLVLTHQIWSSWPAGIITFFGWAMAVEGVAYLFVPDRWINKMFRLFNTKVWYFVGGILAVVIGLYLISVGFGITLTQN